MTSLWKWLAIRIRLSMMRGALEQFRVFNSDQLMPLASLNLDFIAGFERNCLIFQPNQHFSALQVHRFQFQLMVVHGSGAAGAKNQQFAAVFLAILNEKFTSPIFGDDLWLHVSLCSLKAEMSARKMSQLLEIIIQIVAPLA